MGDTKKHELWESLLDGFSKTLFWMGALGLVSICIVRFIFVETKDVKDVLLNLFFFTSGVVVALSQMGY